MRLEHQEQVPLRAEQRNPPEGNMFVWTKILFLKNLQYINFNFTEIVGRNAPVTRRMAQAMQQQQQEMLQAPLPNDENIARQDAISKS